MTVLGEVYLAVLLAGLTLRAAEWAHREWRDRRLEKQQEQIYKLHLEEMRRDAREQEVRLQAILQGQPAAHKRAN